MKTNTSNFFDVGMTFSIEVGSDFCFLSENRNVNFLKFQIGPEMPYHHTKEQEKTSRVTLGTFFDRPNPELEKFWRFM